jgi:hypothetical protein
VNKTDESSGASLLKPGFWRIQLVRLANLFAAGAAASVIFIFLYPDRIALVAAMGGILGVTLALGPRSWQAGGASSWRRLGIALAILDGLAVLLGRLAAVFSAVASPLDDVLLGVFGVSALVMSIGSVPLFTQLFPCTRAPREVGEAAAREPRG